MKVFKYLTKYVKSLFKKDWKKDNYKKSIIMP